MCFYMKLIFLVVKYFDNVWPQHNYSEKSLNSVCGLGHYTYQNWSLVKKKIKGQNDKVFLSGWKIYINTLGRDIHVLIIRKGRYMYLKVLGNNSFSSNEILHFNRSLKKDWKDIALLFFLNKTFLSQGF